MPTWYDETLSIEDKKTEAWKELPSFDGKYDISSLGRIMSHRGRGCRSITPQVNNYGQLAVQLTNHNARREDDLQVVMIGKTVAELFVPNPHNYNHIEFKNGNSKDCRACNIEWVERTDKMAHKYSQMQKKINQYTPNGKYVRTFESAKDAVSHIGKSLYYAIGKNAVCAGYMWRYASDCAEGKDIAPYTPPKKSIVIQLDKATGAEIRRFTDILKASEAITAETGKQISYANIHSCATGKKPSAYGYKWRYAECK